MAVTIVRTPWIDDDGSGTTGTVINNAVKTDLYNQIDGAFAKVAQLAGGNTFTGQQNCGAFVAAGPVAVGGSLTIGGAGVSISSLAPNPAIAVKNTNAADTSLFFMLFYHATDSLCGFIQQTGPNSVNYATTSDGRLKDDDGPAADVSALRAVVIHDFRWKADGIRDRGLFAQEAAALYPRAILAGTDETTAAGTLARPWMTDYSKFVPDLIVGWQQHDADIAEIRAALATLKGSN